MTGYILLYRSICDHWVWQDPKYLQRWLDLLIRATWERKKKLYFQNKVVTIKRGQLVSSLTSLGHRWHTNAKMAKVFIEMLEDDGMIKFDRKSVYSVITIRNYDKFQIAVKSEENSEEFEANSGYILDKKPSATPSEKDDRKQQKKSTNNKSKKDNDNNKTLLNDEDADELLPYNKDDLLKLMTSEEKIHDGCISLKVSEEVFRELAMEVASDWNFGNEKQRTAKHFLNTMRTKVKDLKSKKQRNDKRTSANRSSDNRRDSEKNTAGKDNGTTGTSLRARAKTVVARGEDETGSAETPKEDGNNSLGRSEAINEDTDG